MLCVLLSLLLSPLPLEYEVLHTAGAKATDRLPLIIAVHGLGDRPERFIRLLEDYPLPARVVAPRAPVKHGRGFSWFPTRLPLGEKHPQMNAGIRKSAAALAALAGALPKRFPTKGKPVITGFSQGGVLSFAVAMGHPKVVRGAVPIAGALPKALWSAGPYVPVRALHGDADRIVPLEGAQKVVSALGARATLKVFAGVAHRVPPPVRRAAYEALAELLP